MKTATASAPAPAGVDTAHNLFFLNQASAVVSTLLSELETEDAGAADAAIRAAWSRLRDIDASVLGPRYGKAIYSYDYAARTRGKALDAGADNDGIEPQQIQRGQRVDRLSGAGHLWSLVEARIEAAQNRAGDQGIVDAIASVRDYVRKAQRFYYHGSAAEIDGNAVPAGDDKVPVRDSM